MSLANDTDIAKTLHGISQGLSDLERNDVFTMILEVMAADGSLEPGETRAIELAGQILGLSLDRIYAGLRSFSIVQ